MLEDFFLIVRNVYSYIPATLYHAANTGFLRMLYFHLSSNQDFSNCQKDCLMLQILRGLRFNDSLFNAFWKMVDPWLVFKILRNSRFFKKKSNFNEKKRDMNKSRRKVIGLHD
jgi:hypothetical protein